VFEKSTTPKEKPQIKEDKLYQNKQLSQMETPRSLITSYFLLNLSKNIFYQSPKPRQTPKAPYIST